MSGQQAFQTHDRHADLVPFSPEFRNYFVEVHVPTNVRHWRLKHTPIFRVVLAAACLAGLFCLYFFGLDRCGLLSKDEPRYAAIGLEMARSGDLVMPVLWGKPWFEKPPLLYWMTAVAARAGIPGDLAPRLPVALVGAGFLVVFFATMTHEWGARVAALATAVLATSTGWLAYSHVAVTDLPLSACFATGMFLLMKQPVSWRRAMASGVLLGLAVLAKGLVPLVLLLPAIWFLRREIRALVTVAGVTLLVAAPWYIAIGMRAGGAFFEEFIWKQHFARFISDISQHVQPWWYYGPVLLAGMTPWTPLAALVRARMFDDPRARFLAAWFIWGLVFLSASRNKLPGYVLPLLPAAAVLLALALDTASRAWAAVTLGASALLLCVFPMAERMLPTALLAGIRHTPLQFPVAQLILIVALAAAVVVLELRQQQLVAVLAMSAAVAVAVTHFVYTTYPVLDRDVSAREVWRASVMQRGRPCIAGGSWEFRFGLNYYFGFAVPDCTGSPGEAPLRPAGS